MCESEKAIECDQHSTLIRNDDDLQIVQAVVICRRIAGGINIVVTTLHIAFLGLVAVIVKNCTKQITESEQVL